MRNVFSFDEMSRCLRPHPHTPSLFGIHPCRAEQPSRLLEWVFIHDGAVPIKTSCDMCDAQPGQAEEYHKVLTWAFSHMHMHTCAFFMPTESWLPESAPEQSGEKTGNQHHVTMREESRRNAGVHAAGMTANTPVISLHLHKCTSTASNLTLSDR